MSPQQERAARFRSNLAEMKRLVARLEPFAHHTPPLPQVGGLYRTLNDSTVYVSRHIKKAFSQNQVEVVLLVGEGPGLEPGDPYVLNDDGTHPDREPGEHLLLGLAELLDVDTDPEPP